MLPGMHAHQKKRIVAIINPYARLGRVGDRAREVQAALEWAGLDVTTVFTEKPLHALEIAQTMAREDTILIAGGGDGTVNEVARGIMSSGSAGTMAVLPLGSGNDFARMIGMSEDLKTAVTQLRCAVERQVDVGRVSWEEPTSKGCAHFVNALGIGFDGYAATLVPRFKGYPLGMGYLTAILVALWNWKSVGVNVVDLSSEDVIRYSGGLFFVTVGNGQDSAGGYSLNPKASIFDGMLDVCLVEAIGKLRALRMLPLARTGDHLKLPEVHYWHSTGIRVSSERPLPVHADGEIQTLQAISLDVSVAPGALRVLVPGDMTSTI